VTKIHSGDETESGVFYLGHGLVMIIGQDMFGCRLLHKKKLYLSQAERGFAAWAVFVGRTVVFVRGKGKGA
jgi:hypothetical protein